MLQLQHGRLQDCWCVRASLFSLVAACNELVIKFSPSITSDCHFFQQFIYSTSRKSCNALSVSTLLCLATRGVYERSTIKVLLSTVRINERFGTAIAIWVFSIGSYSSTKGFTVICRSWNENGAKNLPLNRVYGETTQNRRKIVFFLQTEICVKKTWH